MGDFYRPGFNDRVWVLNKTIYVISENVYLLTDSGQVETVRQMKDRN